MVVVPVLFPDVASGVELAAVAELVIVVAFGVLALTFTTIVNIAVSPEATVALEKTTFPVPPTAGVAVIQPAGAVADKNVVFAGTASVTVTVLAGSGPLLVKLIVYVRFWPAITGSGESLL